jgi:hypothetical protein
MSDKNSFEEQSINNLIDFYEEELLSILEGESIENVFNISERKKLRNKGILRFNHPEWFLTDKAKEVLLSKNMYE